MNPTSEYWEGPGLDFKFHYGVNFTVFAVTLHNHVGSMDEMCSARYAVMVTVLGMSFAIGWFRYYDL